MEFKEGLTIDMLPDEGWCKEIARKIGIENLIILTEMLGGTTFYLPKLESLVRPVKNQSIKAEFNGYNHIELALRYNVSERWVRELCGNGIVEGQTSLY